MSDVTDLVIGEPKEYSFETCQTRLDRLGPFVLVDVVYAIAAARGNWADMAKLLGRNRQRVKDWVESRPEVLAYREDVVQGIIDEVEYKHLDSALAGDGSAQRFILSTLAKERGYTIRTENINKNVSDPNDPITQLLMTIAERNKRLVPMAPVIEGEATEIEE